MRAADFVATHMTETELKDNVLALCVTLGLWAMHSRPARTEKGWVTAIEGPHAKGWLDLAILGDHGLLLRELKNATRKADKEQVEWLVRLNAAGADAAIWRPVDWTSGRIQRELEAIAGAR